MDEEDGLVAVLRNVEEKMKLKVGGGESYKKKNVCEFCEFFLFYFFLLMLAGVLVQLNVTLSMRLYVLSLFII